MSDDTLTKNVMNFVLAALVIALLIGGGYAVFKVLANDENQKAQRVLDNVEGKINALEEGEEGKFLIQGFKGAESWYLVAWNKDDEGRPDKCFFENCMCVCKYGEQPGAIEKENQGSTLGNLARGIPLVGKLAPDESVTVSAVSKSEIFSGVCQSNGFCRKAEDKINIEQPIKINFVECKVDVKASDTTLKLEYDGAGVIQYLRLRQNLLELSFIKGEDNTNIKNLNEVIKMSLHCPKGEIPYLAEV